MKSRLFYIGMNETLLNVRVCRTYKGALKNSLQVGSRRSYADGHAKSQTVVRHETARVLLFDTACAPLIADIDMLPSAVRGETTAFEFAERQVVAWAQVAERLRKDEP